MKYRWIVVALALAAASAFALSVQGGRWWTISEVEIGPFGSRSPFSGPGSLAWAGGSERWHRFGIATWAGGLMSMLVLVALAAGVAAKRVPKLAARMSLVSMVTATLAAIGFVVLRPDNDLRFVMSRGVFLFAIAIVLGGIAAVRVLRSSPPPAS